MNTKIVLGVEIDDVSNDETIKIIDNFVTTKTPKQVITVNPEFIMEAQKNMPFRDAINKADLRVPDGIGLVWLGGFRERVSGADLVVELAKKGYKIFLLGGQIGVAEKAGQKLAQFGARIVGAESGGVVTDVKKFPIVVLEAIKNAKPDILLVGFGAPKQDLFIAKHKNYLGAPVSIGVGGAFDYLAGTKPRAPRVIQIIGLEWFWRVILEPKRINRIITATIRFPVKYLLSKIFNKKTSKKF